MSRNSSVRVYMGCSFDGFIAGPGDDISWLERDYRGAGDLPADATALTFEKFMSRRTAPCNRWPIVSKPLQVPLKNGVLGIHRKLYYRELIARFSHHLALNWNLGEVLLQHFAHPSVVQDGAGKSKRGDAVSTSRTGKCDST